MVWYTRQWGINRTRGRKDGETTGINWVRGGTHHSNGGRRNQRHRSPTSLDRSMKKRVTSFTSQIQEERANLTQHFERNHSKPYVYSDSQAIKRRLVDCKKLFALIFRKNSPINKNRKDNVRVREKVWITSWRGSS